MENHITRLLNLGKQFVGIVQTATAKNGEIETLIRSSISDMERINIDVKKHIEDSLLEDTIMMYVKANYGASDIKQKEFCQKRYKEHIEEILKSSKYIKKEGDSNE